MFRLSLIQPPLSAAQRYGGLAAAGNSLPNLGMLQLAAVAREHGALVQLIDMQAQGCDAQQVAQSVARFAPQLAGFTAVTISVAAAAAAATAIKRLLPDTLLMLGGPHVSAVPETTLERFVDFDIGVIGEGERTLIELIDALSAGTPLEPIAGLLLRRDHGLQRSAPRGLINDLDQLPLPAWDLLPQMATRYRPSPQSTAGLPSAILFTSRGCPYHCTFCDRTVFGNRVRSLSAERVVEMIEHLAQSYGIVDFAIHDEIFVLDQPRLRRICELIIERGLRVSWNAQGRADRLLDAQTLALMRQAGCWQMQIGIESGDPTILKLINKGITIDDVRVMLRAVRAAGMHTKAFLMLGLPGETQATLQRTIELAIELPLDDITVTLFTPFPGSQATMDLESYGELVGDWRTMSEYEVSFVPSGLSAGQLERARAQLLRRFYLRPRVIVDYARRMLKPGMAAPLAHGALAFASTILRETR
ncbi:MAG: radical SAM protein [Candidatus Alcyoniella australis]|nr:radical SAM protein [Candidatus Alcyoniella australis]